MLTAQNSQVQDSQSLNIQNYVAFIRWGKAHDPQDGCCSNEQLLSVCFIKSLLLCDTPIRNTFSSDAFFFFVPSRVGWGNMFSPSLYLHLLTVPWPTGIFMSNQRQQKPTLTGQRFKTRKRGRRLYCNCAQFYFLTTFVEITFVFMERNSWLSSSVWNP